SVPKVPAESPVVAGTAAGSRKPAAPAGAEAEAVTPFAHTSLDACHLAQSALVKETGSPGSCRGATGRFGLSSVELCRAHIGSG
ncbi:MAG: hypothetical protein JW751_23025, partial [Polyangiaceae bacterium]|nr:hypothetical protein [Polyangiaceae bacterium]